MTFLKDASGGRWERRGDASAARPARGRDSSRWPVALLLVAGLAVRTALGVQQLDLGFEPRELLTLKTELPAGRYASDDSVRGVPSTSSSRRLAALPGVSGVAVAAARPVLEPLPTEALARRGRGAAERRKPSPGPRARS